MVTARPQPSVMLVKPPCTTSPGVPVPNSTTIATTPLPNKIRTSVPKNSATNSGTRVRIEQREFYHAADAPVSLRKKNLCHPTEFSKLLVSNGKFFGQYTGLAHDAHEVRVTHPTRNYVHVNVSRDASPGARSEVHSYV